MSSPELREGWLCECECECEHMQVSSAPGEVQLFVPDQTVVWGVRFSITVSLTPGFKLEEVPRSHNLRTGGSQDLRGQLIWSFYSCPSFWNRWSSASFYTVTMQGHFTFLPSHLNSSLILSPLGAPCWASSVSSPHKSVLTFCDQRCPSSFYPTSPYFLS